MAAVVKPNGCSDVLNLLELCTVSREALQIDETIDSSLSKLPVLTLNSGVTVKGLSTIAVYVFSVMGSSHKCSSLLGESPLERAEVDQWLDYRQTEIQQALHDRNLLKSVLQDFNCHLEDKVYLVGQQLSLADVMLYYALHGTVKEMMPQEKETVINISRWFYQVQSLLSARQGLSHVTFQRNSLYS